MTEQTGQQKGAEANRRAALRRDEGILDMLEHGWSYAEIGAELNVAPDSVRTVVYRARQRAGIRVRPYQKDDDDV
jgi:DNA-directed RNA polymerase specialized sigma24 family protein